tara:strand:- start:6826 stop:7401 length:576 start_codon:yes stop_codon:yes gene_type:complete
MVRNKKGGKHKHMARKHINASNNFRSRKLREPKESGEIIGRIVKIEGGSNFEVLCNDNKRRLLVVRKKFKGRNKRDNVLKIDTMVMVGLRDWQVLTGKKREKVDLLEVYNTDQLPELKKVKNINLDIFPAGEQSVKDEDNPFEMDFSGSNELLDEDAIDKINENIEKQKEEEKEKEKQKEEEFDDIDWDDI